jgi:starch synthase
MYIVHIATEIAPYAKVGGLADVVYGLAQATKKLGATVEVIVPKYDALFPKATLEMADLTSYEGPYPQKNTIWKTEVHGLPLYLIEAHSANQPFNRKTIYGCPDDIGRFLYFSRTALEYIFKSGKKPDILHLHDWPTAAVAPLVQEMYHHLGFKPRTVLTIHNFEHQGKCSPATLSKTGLCGESFLTPSKMQDPSDPSALNLMKGGIVYADFLTTVSPTYEKEILTPLGGFGLDRVLTQFRHKLKGILNGIDKNYWPPLAQPKTLLKQELQKRLSLQETSAPLVCTISRLAPQKGPLLIHHAILRTLEKGGQFVLLGTEAHSETEALFRALQKKLKKNPNVAFQFTYDEPLARLVYGGADMILIPSITEPCGLTQMISQRYGTIPIVRKTGGLADTVTHEKNGFVFDYPDISGVNWGLDQALACFSNEPTKWQKLVQTALTTDFGWDTSAQAYFKIYLDLPYPQQT